MSVKIDGLNIHVDGNHLPQAKMTGCEWVRIDINWWDIETKENTFNWSSIDHLVNTIYSNHVKIYATLMGTPKWHKPAFNNPPDPTVWARFCSTTARRYGNKIDVYSLWNEPNLGKTFWTGGMKEFFQTIVAPGYTAIKSVNPALKVAAPDLATTGKSKWPGWLSEMRHHRDYFDIVSIHSYHDSASTVKRCFTVGKVPILNIFVPKWRAYNSYLKDLKRPVFLTEVGIPAKYGNSRQEKAQKKFTEQVMKYKKDMDVEQIFFYTLVDANSALEEPFGFYSINWNGKEVVR